MKRETIHTTLAEHKKELSSFRVKSLSIFGSVARGEETEESDLDLLVEFEGKPTYDQYMELKFFLEKVLDKEVDLVTKEGLRDKIRPEVEREAINVA